TTTYNTVHALTAEATMSALAGDEDVAWLGQNRRGDITHTQDTTGVLTSRTTYTDHGVPTTHTNGDVPAHQPYGYTGAYTLNHPGETGNLSLATREANPATAAFTTPDTAPLLTRY